MRKIDQLSLFFPLLNFPLQGLELWRPLTSIVYLGPLSMSWLTNVYFLTQHGTRLEVDSGTAEQVIFLLVVVRDSMLPPGMKFNSGVRWCDKAVHTGLVSVGLRCPCTHVLITRCSISVIIAAYPSRIHHRKMCFRWAGLLSCTHRMTSNGNLFLSKYA